MISYLFLILAQVFATPQQSNNVYQCALMMTRNEAIGSCDMRMLQNHMRGWASEVKQSITESLNNGKCAENKVLNYQIANAFSGYLWHRESGETLKYLSDYSSNKNFNVTLDRLINELLY